MVRRDGSRIATANYRGSADRLSVAHGEPLVPDSKGGDPRGSCRTDSRQAPNRTRIGGRLRFGLALDTPAPPRRFAKARQATCCKGI